LSESPTTVWDYLPESPTIVWDYLSESPTIVSIPSYPRVTLLWTTRQMFFLRALLLCDTLLLFIVYLFFKNLFKTCWVSVDRLLLVTTSYLSWVLIWAWEFYSKVTPPLHPTQRIDEFWNLAPWDVFRAKNKLVFQISLSSSSKDSTC